MINSEQNLIERLSELEDENAILRKENHELKAACLANDTKLSEYKPLFILWESLAYDIQNRRLEIEDIPITNSLEILDK